MAIRYNTDMLLAGCYNKSRLLAGYKPLKILAERRLITISVTKVVISRLIAGCKLLSFIIILFYYHFVFLLTAENVNLRIAISIFTKMAISRLITISVTTVVIRRLLAGCKLLSFIIILFYYHFVFY